MNDQQLKCSQEGCQDAATARVFWPGRAPLLMCSTCATKAVGVGAAMGCYIHAEPLGVTP